MGLEFAEDVHLNVALKASSSDWLAINEALSPGQTVGHMLLSFG